MRNGRERNTGKRTEEAPASRGARDSGRGPDEARLLPADSGGARGVSTGLPRQGSPHASSQAGVGRSHRPERPLPSPTRPAAHAGRSAPRTCPRQRPQRAVWSQPGSGDRK